MEDGLLIMVLVFLFPANPTHFDRALPVPSSHPPGWSANTPRATRESKESGASHAQDSRWGAGLRSVFHAMLLFFFTTKSRPKPR